jgi:hypothetical protein
LGWAVVVGVDVGVDAVEIEIEWPQRPFVVGRGFFGSSMLAEWPPKSFFVFNIVRFIVLLLLCLFVK